MVPTPHDAELIAAATAARRNAYAPFSKFPVGAAVRDETGRVTPGVNVENSSYGLTICAERVAAAAAIAAGAKRIESVAVATDGAAAPCGACRQFLFELGADCRVLLVGADGDLVAVTSIGELLPLGFRLEK